MRENKLNEILKEMEAEQKAKTNANLPEGYKIHTFMIKKDYVEIIKALGYKLNVSITDVFETIIQLGFKTMDKIDKGIIENALKQYEESKKQENQVTIFDEEPKRKKRNAVKEWKTTAKLIKKFYNVNEVAELFNVSRAQVHKAIKQNELKAYKLEDKTKPKGFFYIIPNFVIKK